MKIVRLRGKIEGVRYKVHLATQLNKYALDDFDINNSATSGIVVVGQSELGYAAWVSPKRSRSYPLARVYDIYGTSKRVAVIPIIKDEGKKGDCDRINSITLSMMNLLNVYVILAWYTDAEPSSRYPGKITEQQFPIRYVRERLDEIANYHQSALHWSIMHFERDFERVYRLAIDEYEAIQARTGINLHSRQSHVKTLNKFLRDGKFNRELFRMMTLRESMKAARREVSILSHLKEHLTDGNKAIISLENYLGGVYHLTIDEVFEEAPKIVLQECKNTSKGKIPKITDIKDGLLKLTLYSNIDTLSSEDGGNLGFRVQLKLTGNLRGSLALPSNKRAIMKFCTDNRLSEADINALEALQQEVAYNQAQYKRPITVLITGNTWVLLPLHRCVIRAANRKRSTRFCPSCPERSANFASRSSVVALCCWR